MAAARGRLPSWARRTVDTSDLVQDTLQHTFARLGGFKAGYLHGDVEPSNIGFMLSGLPKLLDFGLAREPNDADTQGGTLRYLSPEVLSGLPAEQADDVWSLCVVLHGMVAGAHPFATTDLDADRVALTDALRRFTRRSAGADVSLVFYAGHGKAIQGRATCSRTASGQRFTWSNRASPENPGARRVSRNRGARSRRERRPRPQVTAKAIPRRGSGHARRPLWTSGTSDADRGDPGRLAADWRRDDHAAQLPSRREFAAAAGERVCRPGLRINARRMFGFRFTDVFR